MKVKLNFKLCMWLYSELFGFRALFWRWSSEIWMEKLQNLFSHHPCCVFSPVLMDFVTQGTWTWCVAGWPAASTIISGSWLVTMNGLQLLRSYRWAFRGGYQMLPTTSPAGLCLHSIDHPGVIYILKVRVWDNSPPPPPLVPSACACDFKYSCLAC